MAASQNIARLGIVLGLDSGELVTKIEEAQKKFGNFKAQIKRDSEDAAKEIVRLEMATRNYGKTLTEVEKIEEQIRLGKYKHQPDIIINSLKAQAAAYDKVAASAKAAEQAKMGKSGGMTAQQQAALGYQTTDIITSLAGGQNPLMVMLQQGGQLRDQFGGFKPLFAGIAAAITPVGVAVTALGGSVLGLGYAMYQGSEEAKKLNAAIVLTGNYAGTTAAQFDVLATSIATKYNVSIGSTKDAMQVIIATGQFTKQSLSSVAELVTSFSKISGESAAVVAEKLIPSLDGTASSAAKLNNQYHFLTFEQYKQIESLEKQGKFQEAITLTSDAFNEKLRDQQKALGPLAQMWKDASVGVANYYETIKKFVSEGDSVATQLDKAKLHFGAMSQAYGKDSEQAKKAATQYYDLLNKLADAASDAEEKAAKADADSKKIKFKQQYGQQLIDLTAKIAEEEEKIKYATAAKGLDAISQLEKKKAMEDAIAKIQLKKSQDKDPQISGKLGALAELESKRKIADLNLQQANISRDELENYKKKALAEEESIAKEQQRLDVYKQNLLASDADLQIAFSRLKTEQQIAEIEANKKLEADPKGRAAEIARLEQIQKAREAVINQAADLKMLQDMNQSVFNNMGNAIDNFVRNGKLSFKDLTRSIIQDLISIAMRAQMMAMFKGFQFFSNPAAVVGGVRGVDNIDVGGGWSPAMKANGGDVQGGMPYYVGEQGPELFVPQGAGTIMPNKMVGAMSNNQPQVVYNGPYIASMSAIDTQSATQFLAKNKQTIWAVNQSAQRSLPVSK